MFGQSSHVHIEIIEALFEKVKDKQKLKIFSQIYKVIPTECKKKKKKTLGIIRKVILSKKLYKKLGPISISCRTKVY